MKKTKRLAMGILMLLTAFICMAAASATTSGPDVRVNGRLVDFPDEKPFIQDGRTYIPVRFVAEALGADVSWSHEIQGAVIQKDGMELQLPIGSKTMTIIIEDVAIPFEMDAAAMKQNGRTLVPIRFVAEALGGWVSYSTAYKTVEIYESAILTPEEVTTLNSFKNHRDVCAEREPLIGKYTFENLNECIYREFNSDVKYTIKNSYNGTTYANGKDAPVKKVQLLADYIRNDLAAEYSNPWLGASASFRTDISNLYASSVSTEPTYINRGFLTITFDEDADIEEFKDRYDYRDFGNIKAGGTYTYVIESVWFLNIASGKPMCMREFNITDGAYDQWA